MKIIILILILLSNILFGSNSLIKKIFVDSTKNVSPEKKDFITFFDKEFEFQLKKIAWFEIVDNENEAAIKIKSEYNKKDNTILIKFEPDNYIIKITFDFYSKFDIKNGIKKIIEAIIDFYPLEGEVISKKNGEYIINLGKNFGIKKNNSFVIIDNKNNPLGLFYPVEIYEKTTSIDLLKKREGEIKEGMKVRLNNFEWTKKINSYPAKSMLDFKKLKIKKIDGISGEKVLAFFSKEGEKFVLIDDYGIWLFLENKKMFKIADYNSTEIILAKFSPDSNKFGFINYKNEFFVYDIKNKKIETIYFDEKISKVIAKEGFHSINSFKKIVAFDWFNTINGLLVLVEKEGLWKSENNESFIPLKLEGINFKQEGLVINEIIISENDKNLIIISNDKLYWADFKLNLVIKKEHLGDIKKIKFTPDGRYISGYFKSNRFKILSDDAVVHILEKPILTENFDWDFSGKFICWMYKNILVIAKTDLKTDSVFFRDCLLDLFQWYPNTDYLIVHGRISDTNYDKVITTEDFNSIFLLDIKSQKTKELIVDADYFLGCSPKGNLFLYQKKEEVFICEQ